MTATESNSAMEQESTDSKNNPLTTLGVMGGAAIIATGYTEIGMAVLLVGIVIGAVAAVGRGGEA